MIGEDWGVSTLSETVFVCMCTCKLYVCLPASQPMYTRIL